MKNKWKIAGIASDEKNVQSGAPMRENARFTPPEKRPYDGAL